MKILFLDIDGVLNSSAYRTNKLLEEKDYSVLIEPEKVEMLRRIVDATEAQIVLSSSWNKFWDFNPVDNAGKRINDALAACGLRIMDKTPWIRDSTRSQQIDAWLQNKQYIEQYAILDDNDHAWSFRHQSHWVQTDGVIGLDETTVIQAISVLHGNLIPIKQAPKKNLSQRIISTINRLLGFDEDKLK